MLPCLNRPIYISDKACELAKSCMAWLVTVPEREAIFNGFVKWLMEKNKNGPVVDASGLDELKDLYMTWSKKFALKDTSLKAFVDWMMKEKNDTPVPGGKSCITFFSSH